MEVVGEQVMGGRRQTAVKVEGKGGDSGSEDLAKVGVRLNGGV